MIIGSTHISSALLFALGVGLVGLLLILRVLFLIRQGEANRRGRLKGRKLLDAIPTESPVADPVEAAKERGLRNIEKHSTVIRRTLIPTIVLLTAAIASLPLLSQVPATLVSIVVGVLTVTLGIAARPVLENSISGLVISFSKLFNIGDTVEVDGFYGTVEDITTTHTTIKIWDWRRYVVPNSKMLQASFINHSVVNKAIWAFVEFSVAPDADLERVQEIAIAAPKSSSHFRSVEAPQFWVMDISESCATCWVAAWAESPSDAWELRNKVRTEILMQLRRAGIKTHINYQRYEQAPGHPAMAAN